MQRKAVLAVAALAASLALAAPALAKPVKYSGKTSSGHEITFKRSGNSITGVYTMLATSCASTYPGATAHAGSEFYEPPGRLPLGRKVTRSAVQDPAMHYSEVTKNYRLKARKLRGGAIKGRLHVNFGYQTVHYASYWMLVGYVCQGDGTFKARPVKR